MLAGFESGMSIVSKTIASLETKREGIPMIDENTTENTTPTQKVTLESLTTEEFLNLVGSRVRKNRMNIGMSRKMLAKKSGVSERYLAQLESGQGNISILLLRKVATAIGVKLDELMAEKEVEISTEEPLI